MKDNISGGIDLEQFSTTVKEIQKSNSPKKLLKFILSQKIINNPTVTSDVSIPIEKYLLGLRALQRMVCRVIDFFVTYPCETTYSSEPDRSLS
jgi:hypothetical protein